MRCIGPRSRDADLWILICEELRRVHQEGILVEVEHAKAHRSKKEMHKCRFSESSTLRAMRKQMSMQERERGYHDSTRAEGG